MTNNSTVKTKQLRGQKKTPARVSTEKQLEQVREQSEKALRQSEERYRSLAEASQDMIFIIGKTGRVEYVNGLAAQIFHRKPEEIIGKLQTELFPAEVAKRQKSNLKVIFDTAKPLYFEAPSSFEGNITWLGTWLVPLKDDNGKVKSVMGVSRDITERKMTEAALLESEEKYRGLVEQSLMGIGMSRGNQILFANPALLSMFGYDDIEEFKSIPLLNHTAPASREMIAARMKMVAEGAVENSEFEYEIVRKDGKTRTLHASTTHQTLGEEMFTQATFLDITERKQAEEALRQSEEDFRQLFEAESDAIFLIDNQSSQILQANSAACNMYGYTREELLAKKNYDLSAEDEATRQTTLKTPPNDTVVSIPLRYHRRKDGTVFPVEITGRFFIHQGRPVHIAAIRDITERKRAEDALKASQERLNSIFRVAPIGIGMVSNRILKEVNQNMLDLIGYTREELLDQSALILYPDQAEFERVGREKYADIRKKGTGVIETRWKRKDGKIIDILLSSTALNPEDLVAGVMFTAEDITERKRAEEALREREFWLRESQRVGRLGSYRFDIAKGEWQSTETLDTIFGIDSTYLKTPEGWLAIIHPEQRQEMKDYLEKTVVGGKNPFNKEYRIVRMVDQQVRWVHGMGELSFNAAGDPILVVGTIQDITERRETEAALSRQAEELRRRNEELARLYRASGSLLSGVTSNLPILAQTIVRVVQQEFGQSNCSLFTIRNDTDELLRLAVVGPYSHRVRDKKAYQVGPGAVAQAIRTAKVVNIRDTTSLQDYAPDWDSAQSELAIPLKIGEVVIGVIDIQSSEKNAFTADDERLMVIFAERAALTLEHGRLNAQIETRMKQLISMRTVDMAIASSFDLDLILGILLDQLTGQLNVHAAAVLAFDANTQTFQFACERGFRTLMLHHTRLGLGESHAGRVAQERKTITIPDLQKQPGGFHKYPDLSSEQFTSYIGVPLIAKGQIKGVLEIFHRDALTFSRDEYAFLETLASQSAIAIDNSGLFENLQRSNADLTIAYDSTLEGWAKALELRDKETEGHTHRVTDMTTTLARSLGIAEGEIMHVYRGALLHDIGKMGVPDSVVLKPGPLTVAEWEIMRRHPQYAYELLSPIPFLKQSLDIPYCHHEKWDGSGYPRGLKGNEIPLAARIFAVVDVWDALTSDRPYRSAWTGTKTLEYIKDQTGIHFDPEVVTVFLNSPLPKGLPE